jgi:hypothetical protein
MIKIYNFFKNNTIIDTFQNAINNTIASVNPIPMTEQKKIEEKIPAPVVICAIDNSNTLKISFPDITSPQLKWNQDISPIINVSCSNNQLFCINATYNMFYIPNLKKYDSSKMVNIPPPPTGALTHISFDGYNMIVMGLNSAGSVFYANKDITTKPNWTQIPGELVNISYSNKQAFGINSAGAIFYNRDYTSGNWVKVNGELSNISFDGYNMIVMGTNKAGSIYYANETITVTPQWRQVNGGLKMVSLSNKEVYGVNGGGDVYHVPDYTTGAWTKVGSGFKQISFDNPGPNGGAFDLTTWMAQNPDMVMYIGIGFGFLILIIIIVLVSSKRSPQNNYRRPQYNVRPQYNMRPQYNNMRPQYNYRKPAYKAPVEVDDE